MSYCKSHRPEVVVLENVDDLLSATSPKYTYLMNAFRVLGYVGDAADVMSTQYYCPQGRRRAYLIFYLCPAASDPDTIVTEHLNPAIALAKRFGSSLERMPMAVKRMSGRLLDDSSSLTNIRIFKNNLNALESTEKSQGTALQKHAKRRARPVWRMIRGKRQTATHLPR